MNQTNPHPEWKRLFASISPLIFSGKRQFTYAELKELAGIDIQSNRGRRQFHRFMREALIAWQVWFDNERNLGYTVVSAAEHATSAHSKTKQAARRLKLGLAIAVNTDRDALTEPQIGQMERLISVLSLHAISVANMARDVRRIADKTCHPEKITKADLEAIGKEVQKIQ